MKTSNGFQRFGYPELRTTLQLNTALQYWKDENARLIIGKALNISEVEERRKFQEKKRKFEHLIKRLEDEFLEDYDSGDRRGYWWPLGYVELHKEFMNPKFLAKNATQNSDPMPEQIAVVAKQISHYLKVLEQNWPEAGA